MIAGLTWRGLSRLLWTISLLSLAVGVAAIFWGTVWPLHVPPPAPEAGVIRSDSVPRRIARPALQAKDFQFVWNKPLRRPLIDEPATVRAVAPTRPVLPPTPAPKLRLIGTMIDPTQRWALLQLSTGELKLLQQGQVLDEASPAWKLTQVEPNGVVVESSGREHAIELKPVEPLLPAEAGPTLQGPAPVRTPDLPDS